MADKETPTVWTDRHPSTRHFEKLFDSDHLPEHLAAAVRPIRVLVEHLVDNLPDGPELSAGLRKFLEGKDAMVRARVLAEG